MHVYIQWHFETVIWLITMDPLEVNGPIIYWLGLGVGNGECSILSFIWYFFYQWNIVHYLQVVSIWISEWVSKCITNVYIAVSESDSVVIRPVS